LAVRRQPAAACNDSYRMPQIDEPKHQLLELALHPADSPNIVGNYGHGHVRALTGRC
jgi:hypothetical protein